MQIKVTPMGKELYEARQSIPILSQAILFGGDRWLGITHGAIAIDGDFVIGFATMRLYTRTLK